MSIQSLAFNGFILISSTLSSFAQAHSIEDRYDLPLPLPFFIIGSGIVVLMSFLFLFFATPSLGYINKNSKTVWHIFSQLIIQRLVIIIAKAFSIILFFTVLGACFWGNPDPLENLAPNFIWITWWLGLSLVISFSGNFWPIINPWNALFEVFQWALKKISKKIPNTLNLPIPPFLGMYISTGFLLTWSWLELVYPVAFVPQRIGQLIAIWTCINFIFMCLFGVKAWQTRGDVFSVYFFWLGKFGLYFYDPEKNTLERRYLGQGLWSHHFQHNQSNQPLGLSSFIVAMLSTVLFDGLHGSAAWLIFEQYLTHIFPKWLVVSAYFSGTLGLLMTWLLFWGLFWCCCFIPQKYCSTIKLKNLADYLAPSLIPIAVGYLIAHNFSSFIIQFQNIIFLISDPFHLGWDLFHTKTFRPNIAIIDAGFTWYLALSAILVGHILALWISHLLLVQKTQLRKDLLLMSVAHTMMMVGLTMTSLIIIAEPMALS